MRAPLFNIRLDEETKTRWQAAADEAGMSLSEYVRGAVDAQIATPAPAELVEPAPTSELETAAADGEREAAVMRQDSPSARVQPGAAASRRPAPAPAVPGGKVFRGPDPKPEPTKKQRR